MGITVHGFNACWILMIIGLSSLSIEARSRSPRSQSTLCRPDQVYESNLKKCIRLKNSISVLVKDIVDNSDTSLPFLHYNPDATNQMNITVPNEVRVSDLFIQNLAFINEANMTNCLAMSACNEHCYSWPERTAEQKSREKTVIDQFISTMETTNKKEEDDETPDFVKVIMQASKKGIDFARNAKANSVKGLRSACLNCQNQYSASCPPLNYAYTVRINALYRKLIESNVSFVDLTPKLPQNLSPEMLYYHYSMHFVERANLTSCYSLVSCENTCQLYSMTITELGMNMVEPPASESTLMKGDPNKSKSIDIIHNAAIAGYKMASTPENECHQCRQQFPDCTDDKYEIAKASAAIFGN